MNNRDLKYIVAVAEYGHFGRAAEACFVSQPALSMQIKKLEDRLGVQLFERDKKSVLVTDVGYAFIRQAQDILKRTEDLIESVQYFKDPFKGDLKIGAFPTLAAYFFPQMMSVFQRDLPEIKAFLIEEKTDVLIQLLKSGQIDVALLALPVDDDKLFSSVLFEDPFYLAVAQANDFAARQSVSYADLQDINLLLLDDGHCLRDQALDVCHLMGVRNDQSDQNDFRATSLETLRHMVAANIGMTLMPAIAKREHDGITYIPFKEDRPPARHIGLFWRKTSPRVELFQKIVDRLTR